MADSYQDPIDDEIVKLALTIMGMMDADERPIYFDRTVKEVAEIMKND